MWPFKRKASQPHPYEEIRNQIRQGIPVSINDALNAIGASDDDDAVITIYKPPETPTRNETIGIDDKWKQVGIIGVDAGLCWLGDPCYWMTPDCTEHPAETWSEFCDKLEMIEYPTAKQFNFKRGHAGLGVCVSTGYGDGIYPVFVEKNEEGHIVGVMVRFDEE